MSLWLWVLVLVLAGAAQETVPMEASQDSAVDPALRLEMEVRRAEDGEALENGAGLWESEVVLVDVLLEGEPNFLDHQVVAQWRMPLDLQMGLSTPFAESPAAGIWNFHGEPEPGDTSLVVDRNSGTVKRLPDTADGWRRYRWRRAVVVQGPNFQLPSASVHVVWATHFEQDLVRGAVPLDRHETIVESTAFGFLVSEVPPAASHQGFKGAVGAFQMSLTQLDATGDGIHLQLEISGTGVLTAEHFPDLGRLDGVHVFGQRIEKLEDGLRLHLEMQVDPHIHTIPSVPWSYFNPRSPAQFETIIPPPLALAGREPIASTSDAREEGQDSPTDSSPALHPFWYLLGAGVVGLILLGLRGRSDATQPARPAHSSQPSPLPSASSSDSRSVAPVLRAPKDLLDYIAIALNCTRVEVYADDLEQKMLAVGIPRSLASDLVVAVDSMKQERYAGVGSGPSVEEQRQLQRRLGESRRAT